MTDPITPAEAAAAAAIDSVNAANANQSASGTNEDLLEDNPTDEQIAAAAQHARDLETRLATIRARKSGQKVAAGQGVPHAVPAAAVPNATDKPVVHPAPATPAAAPVKVAPVQLVNGKVVTPAAATPAAAPVTEGAVNKSSSFSAQLQAKLASGWVKPKYVKPSQRNRK